MKQESTNDVFKDHVVFTTRQFSMLVLGLLFAGVGLTMFLDGSPVSLMYNSFLCVLGLGFLVAFGLSTTKYLKVLKARKLQFKFEANNVKVPGN